MADVSNYYNDTVVNGTDSVDYIYSSGINVKIYGGADDDKIENRGYEVTIEAGDGNDSVWTDVLVSYGSSNYRSATVDGGDGDDTITVNDNKTSLNGGAGDDVIRVNGSGGSWSNNTLQGGKGNDEIYGGGSQNVFVYEDGDGDDTIYYAKTGDTVQIATNSGYESIVSGYDLIVNVGSGKMTFKNAAGKSLNIVTEAYTGIDYTEVRQISAQALEDFLATGKGTDTTPVDPLNEFAQQISKSEFYVIRLMGKIFGEMTKYELNDDGTFKLDQNGNKIEDHSVNKTRIDAGYKAILELNDILDSARKIAKGEMTKAEVFNESLKIATKITNFTDQLIIEFAGDPKAGFITPMGSAAVGLVTNVITCFTDGASTGEIKSILTNGSKLLTETLKRLGKNKQIKDTAFGGWLNGKTSGSSQKIKDFVNGALGKDINFYIETTLNAVVGVYSAITTYLDNNEQYTVDGLPDSAATINKTIDVVADVVHSFSNVFMRAVTLGIADADTIFKGVHTVASAILWSFQSGLARITGGDPSQVKFQTTDKNFAEIIGDALKNVITGTTDASRIFNDEDNKPIHAIKGDQHITNYGSYCSITSGAGDDMIFNHAGTQSNDVDGGSDDDYIGVYGPSNTVKGGQGADSIALYSDGKTPAGGNMLDGGTGTDFIFVDDSKCTTLPRRSNNTIIGGEGNDLIGIENTKIPVVIRYTAGDGKDIVFGYEKNDTIQIVNGEYSTSKSGQDVIISVGNGGAISLMGAKNQKLNIEKITDDGLPEGLSYDKKKIKLTAKSKFRNEKIDLANFASTVTKVDASSLFNAVNIKGNSADNSIKGGKGNDTLWGDVGNDTLLGNNGNDTIYGGNGVDSIDGGKGDDFIFGGVGNDFLKGGDGNDTFVYANGDGKDVITDYAANKDKIKISSGKISNAYVNGSNVVFTIGTGSLTVKNGKGKNLTLIDSKGKSSSTILGGKVFTVDDFSTSPVTLGSSTKNVDASARTIKVKIIGNSSANSIFGGTNADTIDGGKGNDTIYGGNGKDSILGGEGYDKLFGDADDDTLNGAKGNDSLYGGSGKDSISGDVGNDKIFGDAGNDKLYGGTGNDTLTGGKGNDSLWGDAGKDVFIYANGDGKDVIFGFDGSDMLEIFDALFTGTYNKSKKEIAFKVGSTSNAITLRDFTATTFNVNGDTYQISGTKLVK